MISEILIANFAVEVNEEWDTEMDFLRDLFPGLADREPVGSVDTTVDVT